VGERRTRVDQRLERRAELELLDAHGADLADARARPEPRRLEVEDHVGGLFEQRITPWPGEADGGSDPAQSRVPGHEVVEE
jgi:hypothetical protein